MNILENLTEVVYCKKRFEDSVIFIFGTVYSSAMFQAVNA